MTTIFYNYLPIKQLLTIIAWIGILLYSYNTQAQSTKGQVSGLVKDSSGTSMQHVSVALKGTNKSVNTKEDGSFEMSNISPGPHVLIIRHAGFSQVEKAVEIKSGETASVADIILLHDIHQLEDIVINSQRNRYKISEPSSSLRIKSPIIEIPQNIQVVTKDVLKDQQIISMSDGLVRNVSGLVRAEHWGDLYTNITARGGQVQAYRNGFNVVNSYWGPLTEDMSFVESIEFVKGPAGFMLSSGDPCGLYNVVTKKPTGQTKGEASVTFGSYNLYRATLDLDGKLSEDGRLLYRLNISAQNKNSHRANEYNNRYVIAPVISYQLDSKTKLTAEYTYQRANMSNVGSFYVFSPGGFASYPRNFTSLPAGTPGTQINDHSFFLNLQHDFNSNWKITAQAARFIYLQEGTSMWPSAINPDGKMIRNIGIWDAESNMTMGQVFVNGEMQTGPVRHRILTGLDMGNKNYIADWGQSHDLDTTGAEFDPLNPDLGTPVNGYPVFDRSKTLEERAYSGGSFQNQTYYSLYAQDELAFINNRLRLTVAGRYTQLKQEYYGAKSARRVTPRIGLSGSVNKSTVIYALYDQSFIPQSGRLTSGKTIHPITGNNMELGIKKDWSGGRWNTTLAIYRIVKNNEITPDLLKPSIWGLSIELGQKRAQGIEFDLRGTIVKGLHLIANYAYTDSRVTKVSEGVTVVKIGDIVPGYSKHTLNTWLNYKIQAGILKSTGLSVGCTWLADRATYWQAAPDPSKEMKDYFKVEGGVFWENEKIRVAVNVFNLLNKYLYSGSYESYFNTPAYSWQSEPGRNFRMSVNYNF